MDLLKLCVYLILVVMMTVKPHYYSRAIVILASSHPIPIYWSTTLAIRRNLHVPCDMSEANTSHSRSAFDAYCRRPWLERAITDCPSNVVVKYNTTHDEGR
jgi:hypothetical protein